jgi:hypothetical protein
MEAGGSGVLNYGVRGSFNAAVSQELHIPVSRLLILFPSLRGLRVDAVSAGALCRHRRLHIVALQGRHVHAGDPAQHQRHATQQQPEREPVRVMA